VLPRHAVLRAQALITGKIDLRALQHGFVARELSFGLRQSGFGRPRGDFRPPVAFLDVGTFLEVDLLQVTADLAPDGYGGQRGNRAETVEVDPDITLADNL